ncbi:MULTISPECIES: DUF4062 domain-containing protein [Rhodopseudomonas]|uniref:DUF4062 domain-containing protein n=1 Tax=Rhodopseudomonas palustris TaxID=1076 RepID=A0A0D7EXW1_RHOPL|nr:MULTISPECIES: DUF4062 domain-containing protein [Rhodopseudomonas]KIZ45663.1 hypothetical protein OO17_07600 [Rhodopseudomonas palustris]MDF3810939.1 DUF4062 domain-containing protein [Rhodopseudomonas sp. BAL398]WOK19642.1 DUF4062 domain-containing protein [Rhodopseudomonas sp. BAL398]
MPDTRKIIRVFLASPGDLQDERRAAKAVVDEFNKLWADSLGYHVELIGWEDTISQYGRPQATINQDLERCELVIGMIWKRWGTPPSKSGPFTSGFEEEFETSLTSRRSAGRPELALFFKEVDKELLRDPGEELKKVVAFREKVIAEKEILFVPFKDLSEFEGKVRASITSYVQKLRNAESQKLSNETQATPTEPQQVMQDEEQPARDPSIAGETARFLRTFLTAAESSADNYTAIEVARLRLVATTVKEPGNDDTTIGAHDANLLFAQRSVLTLDRRENFGLVRSGLENLTSENVPLWHWYMDVDGFERGLLCLFSIFKDGHRIQANALLAARLIEEPLPISKEWPREFFLQRWLNKDTQSEQKSAALAYLADCGLPEDVPSIKEEFDRTNYQTRSASVDAILRINLRQGREQAIRALYELQPDSVDRQLLACVFEKDVAFDEEILVEGTSHRSASVRRITATILAKRGKLTVSDAERLLSDTDEDVRYVALRALADSGRTFTEEQAQSILLRQTGSGILGGPGAQSGGRQFAKFRETILAAKTDAELGVLAANESVFQRDVRLALLQRQFARQPQQLTSLIEDQFHRDFAKAVAEMASRYGEDNQLVKDTQGLGDFLRKGFTRQALDIVCKAGGAEHLKLVRNALESNFVDYSRHDVEYLQKHGEWQDIPLIIAAAGRSEAGTSLLGADHGAKYRSAAKAMYAIGKKRLAELLEQQMPKSLLARLIIEISESSYRNLTDAQLKKLFLDEDDSVRKACALKAVRTFSKTRLAQLLKEYVGSDGHRYYNVVHWLDLGVSVPKDGAKLAATKAITKDWPESCPVFD